MRPLYLIALSASATLLSLLAVGYAQAQERNIRSSQVRYVSVSIKKRDYSVACVSKVPGTTKTKKKKLYFLSLADEIKNLSRLRRLSASQKKRLALVKSLRKPGASECKTKGPPEHLSLVKYTGNFGVVEAQTLFDRFGFSGTPAQINEAVRTGLDATVARLISYTTEPGLDAEVADMECDNWLASDTDRNNGNRQCDPSDINDMDYGGIRNGLLYRFLESENQFALRLTFFLMDERLATSINAVGGGESHAAKTYLAKMLAAGRSGNYKQYMVDMNSDHLMHLKWLDGATNRGGLAVTPNENYAREFWELGTVGPRDLRGNPVYTDLDVAMSALAFTGWQVDYQEINGRGIGLASYIPLLHTNGPKIIFRGTPYQATVENANDVLEATFQHPRTSEHLAEDIWKEFVNPFATADQIRELAQIIRDNNFNLYPVFRRIMSSKALYSERSRKSILKHPIDLFIGLARVTGRPFSYRELNDRTQDMEQSILDPDTVFGWNVQRLAGEQLQIAWWNTLVNHFLNDNQKTLFDETGYSFYNRFVADLYAAGQVGSGPVIDRVARELGIPLTAGQKVELDQLMNYSVKTNGCPAQCSGQPFKLERQAYDSNPLARESQNEWSGQRKIRMLIAALMQLPEARMK